MRLKDQIASLSEKNRHTLELYSDLIAMYTSKGNKVMPNEYSHRVRGYLDCMVDSGMITDCGRRSLYLWYCSERVRSLLENSDTSRKEREHE